MELEEASNFLERKKSSVCSSGFMVTAISPCNYGLWKIPEDFFFPECCTTWANHQDPLSSLETHVPSVSTCPHPGTTKGKRALPFLHSALVFKGD
jgi:hypothetical protein